MDKNFKPVIGFDDNLSNRQQNYAHTAYAVGKMRAGRTPTQWLADNNGVESETVVTDMNKLFKPDLYFMEAGATHADNGTGVSEYSCYVYNIVQDPDESTNCGHKIPVNGDHRTITMNFRQIQYSNSPVTGTVTTRVGIIDSAVAQLSDNYKKIATIQKIYTQCKNDTPMGTTLYAYVNDIGMWIRYQVINTSPQVTVQWEPAITWSSWKSIAGDSVYSRVMSNITAELNTHYVSFGEYILTLPNANDCPVGSKVTLDQWARNGLVRAVWGGNQYEIVTTPAVKTVGLSDMKMHNDNVLPDGSLFVYDGVSWACSYDDVMYIVKKVTLQDGAQRFALVTSTSNEIIRICYTDVAYPHLTSTWFNVNAGGTHYTPADIDLSVIATSVPVNLKFTTNDIADNICGCTTYTFEVTYDEESDNAKRWVLTRSSDMEAYLARINTLLTSTVQDHTARIGNLEISISNILSDVYNTKRKYTHNEKIIALSETDANTIYGDNAKVAGEPLIVYTEGNWVDPNTLGDTSYIVSMFLARLTPVYFIARNVSSSIVKTIYLPTRSSSMLGKKIKIVLAPWASVNVVDDNSTEGRTYTLSAQTPSEGDTITSTEITFELVQYIDHNNTTKYAWSYSARQFATNDTY